MSFLFDELPENPLIDRFIDLSFEVSEHIIRLLKQKGMSQRDLANLLEKKDSEVSRWLQGDHNFTLKTIAAVEIALQEEILKVPGIESKVFVAGGLDDTSVFSFDNKDTSTLSSSNKPLWSKVSEYNRSAYPQKSYTELEDYYFSGSAA